MIPAIVLALVLPVAAASSPPRSVPLKGKATAASTAGPQVVPLSGKATATGGAKPVGKK